MPSAAVPNLTFREAHVRQSVPLSYHFPILIDFLSEKNAVRAKGSVTNDSPYELKDVRLITSRGSVSVPDIAPGKTASLDALMKLEQRLAHDGPEPVRIAPVHDEFAGVMLTARIVEFQVGSTIGTESGPPPRLVFTYDEASGVPKKR